MEIDYVEEVKRQAEAMLAQVDAMASLADLAINGRFVFSPPSGSRIVVNTLADLHAARKELKKRFGWKDTISNKFYSCGEVIVTYEPRNPSKLPLPFSLWVTAPPEVFPKELLGDCTLQKVESDDYAIVCPVEG